MSRERSSTPEPSKAQFQRSSLAILYHLASENAAAPAPSSTTGRLSPRFVHLEKQREARPCFPTSVKAENESEERGPAGPGDHRGKVRSLEGWSSGATGEVPMHSAAAARRR